MAFATLFDSLYCAEEHLDLFQEPAEERGWLDPEQRPPVLLDDELPALFDGLRGKEEVVLAAEAEAEEGDGYGGAAGREAAVGWTARAAAMLGFSALTATLAAAYLDRCFLGGALRLGGRPWMARLAAVACVALAAKVEETRVPLLLDLQLCAAEGADAYVFEAKTVRRMELLVLSALGWRMHPVTPLSYLHPLLGAGDAARLHHCETALLAVMADWRWPRHRPSAWAAAALLETAGCGGDAELLSLINAPKDEAAECAKIISEEATTGLLGFYMVDGGDNKRKRAAAGLHSPPLSPSGVVGFSCESSSSSADTRSGAVTAWPASASVSSCPEPPGRPFKRATTTAMPPLPLGPDEESRDAWPSAYAA